MQKQESKKCGYAFAAMETLSKKLKQTTPKNTQNFASFARKLPPIPALPLPLPKAVRARRERSLSLSLSSLTWRARRAVRETGSNPTGGLSLRGVVVVLLLGCGGLQLHVGR